MATGSRDLTPGGHPDLKPVRARREANTIMDFYDLADFSEPLRHGVPVGPQALDLAAPEVWCAWVRACAEAKSAERREAANNRLREERAQRNVAALRRRTTPYEAAEPFPWWAQPSPPLIASGHTGPGTGIPEAVRLFRESPAGREKTANRTARKSVLARLAEGTLRAFARPGNGRAPWHWILAHEWASGDATRDQRLPGAITLSGSMYWMAHIFDPIGVPLDQAAVAYGQAPEATKMHARAAIGRRMAGGADRDAAEESALAAERGNLLSRLRAGALFAFRGGAELPREEFEREGALGEISTWERADDVLVRPPPPPRAVAAAEADSGTNMDSEEERHKQREIESAKAILDQMRADGLPLPTKRELYKATMEKLGDRHPLTVDRFERGIWPEVATDDMKRAGRPPAKPSPTPNNADKGRK